MAQAYAESGLGVSELAKTNKNLFGMRLARTRSTLAIGEEYGFAVFDSWKESVIDYKLWQNTVFGVNSNVTEEVYYETLDKIYSNNNQYSNKIKEIIRTNNIKKYF